MRGRGGVYAKGRPAARARRRPRLTVATVRRRPRGAVPLALLAGAAAVALVLHSPLFRVDEVRVRGLERLSAAEVQRQAGLTSRFYLWQLRPRLVEERLRRHPRVAGARVLVRWPRHVVLAVAERHPAAYVRGVGPRWLEVDAGGHVLSVAGDRVPLALPLVTVERTLRAEPGRRLGVPGLKAALQAAVLLGARWGETASEIHVRQDGQLVLYLADGVPVHLGWGEDVAARLRLALGMMAAVERREAVAYVDVRSLRRPVVGLREGFAAPPPPPPVPADLAVP